VGFQGLERREAQADYDNLMRDILPAAPAGKADIEWRNRQRDKDIGEGGGASRRR
jgi:hypothetical protein